MDLDNNCKDAEPKVDMKEEIIKWFIEDIKDQLAWTDADVSEERILEIAKKKTDDLIEKCIKAGIKFKIPDG